MVGASNGDDEPRNEELEAAIAHDPYDPDAYAVYADWLQQRDHVRGELIATQLAELRGSEDARETRADLLALHAGALLGPLADDRRLVLTWRCGFIHIAAGLADDDAAAAELLLSFARLLAHPSARLLVRLETLGIRDGAELARLLVAALPPTLRHLRIGVRTDIDLAGLWGRCRRLRQLDLRAGSCELGDIALPYLERAKLDLAGTTATCARAIGAAHWPELVELDLSLGGTFEVAALRPLLHRDLPSLARLRLHGTACALELVRELPTTPLAEQLVVLDLEDNHQVQADDLRQLARAKDRFPRLRELRVPARIAGPARGWFAGTRVELVGVRED